MRPIHVLSQAEERKAARQRTKAATDYRRRETFRPLNLKLVLLRYGLPQQTLADALSCLVQRKVSRVTVSLLLNWGVWPKRLNVEQAKGTIERTLLAAGVSPQEISLCWQEQSIAERTKFGEKPAERIPGLSRIKRTQRARRLASTDDLLHVEAHMLTPQARTHFSITVNPFQQDVQGAKDVFSSASMAFVREAMYQAAANSGFVAVVGEAGAGKTVLRRYLQDRVATERLPIRIVYHQCIVRSLKSSPMLCEAVNRDLDPTAKIPVSLESKTRFMQERLLASSRANYRHVLIIEEAHDLSVPLLKFLKRFWELEDGFRKLIGIILIGKPELKLKLDERMNWEAREVIRRCELVELEPLGHDLEAYLSFKLKRVAKSLDDVFTSDALPAIERRLTQSNEAQQTVSLAYPLSVNNLVVRAMNLAATLGIPKVSAEVIENT